MKSKISAIVFLGAALLFGTKVGFAQSNNTEPDPIEFLKKNKPSHFNFAVDSSRKLMNSLKLKGYPYATEAAAIVFPELIRYSEFQDQLESLVNQLLTYVSEESNGFSIGNFQMKPDFAAKIEMLVSHDSELSKKHPRLCFDGDTSTSTSRRERLLRLTDWDWQCEYLTAFMDYEIKALKLKNENLETRTKYLALAYNAGIFFNRQQLDAFSMQKSYPSGTMFISFSYYQISLGALDYILK